MTRCTINSKNLCIFALRGTCFPSIFSVSAVFFVVNGSHTDLNRFDPRRPYSIKTRIKTIGSYQSMLLASRRPYSIKTRIKTLSINRSVILIVALADHIPLKQGLRLGLHCCIDFHLFTRRPYSIKTRIKTPGSSTTTNQGFRLLADHIPLKQGLRRSPETGEELHSG